MSIFDVKPLKSTATTVHPLSSDPDDFAPVFYSAPISNFRVGPSMQRFSSNFSHSASENVSSSQEMENMTDNLFTDYGPTMFDNMTRQTFPTPSYPRSIDKAEANFQLSTADPVPQPVTSQAYSNLSVKTNPTKQEDFQDAYTRTTGGEPPAYSSIEEAAPAALETSDAALSALDFAPGVIGSSIISETTNSMNQQRTQAAQFNPNFDARNIASMENSQQSQIAGIGSTATLIASGIGASVGSAFGPAGSAVGSVAGAAIGMGATAIAEHYSNVDPNTVNATDGGVTSAADSA